MDDTMERTIQYISDRLLEEPSINKSELIEETSNKFDLTPIQEDFLINKFILNV